MWLGDDVFLYYDVNCDGNSGDAKSEYGHPQWVVAREPPDVTRAFDLDNDGECLRDTANGGLYTHSANYDWTPPSQDVMYQREDYERQRNILVEK